MRCPSCRGALPGGCSQCRPMSSLSALVGAVAEQRIYPCAHCPKMRTASEGGTVFTVCDACWDKAYPKPTEPQSVTTTHHPDGGTSWVLEGRSDFIPRFSVHRSDSEWKRDTFPQETQ